MFRKLLLPVVILSMVFFTQCSEVSSVKPASQDTESQSLKAKGHGNGGGGQHNGKGNGGNNAENGGSDGTYGDLIICLRDIDGIPFYESIQGEHGLSYYPLPIKFNPITQEPVKNDDGTYQTFELDSEGDVITESEYIVKEVEFGRLNIVRAPQSVLDQALGEAIASLTQPGVTAIKTDASGRLIAIIGNEDWLVNYDNDPSNDEFDDKTIDAPREDIAIYQELMSKGMGGSLSFLAQNGFSESDALTLAFGAVAAGADKTGIINVDELAYMNNWLLNWQSALIAELPDKSPDVLGRHYYNYRSFAYNRAATYGDKYVRITTLKPNGSWTYQYKSLLSVVPWTSPAKLIDYSNGANTNISGFANAADDAVQVIEFLHSSDLIVYSPYFTSHGFDSGQ